ncbi:FAD-dependent monooxygenase [Streptomyces hundungensis]|uniref:FAD-dependent monooxygenase n=1 Tax=Streptomyces hundungensis TaxID=1077946 RepID=UPI0033D4E3E4
MHDVVIVGAGPVGLFLACELGIAGCSVLVLECEPQPQSPLKAEPFGMRGLSGASVGAFYRRGLLPQLLSASGMSEDPGAPAASPLRGAGHFAGMMLDPARIDVDSLPYWLPSPAPRSLRTHLEAVETVLSERASGLGVDIRYGVAVTDVTQNERGAVAHADGHTYPARWLVGCDGGRSTVRKLAGFPFEGTEPQFTGYSMQVTVAVPEKLDFGFHLTPQGMYLRLLPGHLAMMDFDGGAFDRSRQPTLDHLQSVLRRVSGTDVTLSEVQLATTFTDRAMQATTYRQGRVLLAGDAAHIHSPLGGQGLNLGIGDAMNLGWKLAATVRGHAPQGLLDTYTRERRPVGAAVLDWSRAQVAVMRPGPYAQAVQGVVRDLIGTRDGTTYVFERISGAWIRYDLGGEHPLVGRDAPDLHLEDGSRLGDLMGDGRGVVLDFSAEQSLRPAAKNRESRLRYVAGAARNDLGLGAVLVRPDGVVVWADGRAPDRQAFEAAVSEWFGDPES